MNLFQIGCFDQTNRTNNFRQIIFVTSSLYHSSLLMCISLYHYISLYITISVYSQITVTVLLFQMFVESEFGFKMLQLLFDAVSPVSLRPVDVMLKTLFSSPDLVSLCLSSLRLNLLVFMCIAVSECTSTSVCTRSDQCCPSGLDQ